MAIVNHSMKSNPQKLQIVNHSCSYFARGGGCKRFSMGCHHMWSTRLVQMKMNNPVFPGDLFV